MQANSLLRSRRYEEAIALYEEVRRKGQHPHGIIDFNLDLARRRLTSSGISRPSPLPRKQHARGVMKLNAFSFAEESCATYLKSSAAKQPRPRNPRCPWC